MSSIQWYLIWTKNCKAVVKILKYINRVLSFRELKYSVSGHYSGLKFAPWERFETMFHIWFDAELNGLQNGVQIFLGIGFWPRYLVKILGKSWNRICKKNVVFWLFAFNIETEEKRHVYHFVEQVKLYRLVYNSIWTVDRFEGKNSHESKSWIFCIFHAIFEGVSGNLRNGFCIKW